MKEKTEHPLIAKCNEALKVLSSYYDALCDQSAIDNNIKNSQERVAKLRAWCKEHEPLYEKAVRIYETLRPDLGLPYDPRELIWWNMEVDLLKNLGKLQDVIQRVRELKERTQLSIETTRWELEKESSIPQTPSNKLDITELVTEEVKLGSISVHTNPKYPVAGKPFELTIESEGFCFGFTKEIRHKIYSCIEDPVYITNGIILERSSSCLKTKEFIEFPGDYVVMAYDFEVIPGTGMLRYFKTDVALLKVYPQGQFGEVEDAKTLTAQKKETPYQWEFNPERHEVTCNGSKPIKLEPRLFDLFEYLHRKKQATLERIRKDLKIEERYKHLVANRVGKLISALDKEAKVLGLEKGEIKRIIERERDGRKLVKVIFHAS